MHKCLYLHSKIFKVYTQVYAKGKLPVRKISLPSRFGPPEFWTLVTTVEDYKTSWRFTLPYLHACMHTDIHWYGVQSSIPVVDRIAMCATSSISLKDSAEGRSRTASGTTSIDEKGKL